MQFEQTHGERNLGAITLMYSGGMDSFVAYHYAKDLGFDIRGVYVALGHEYQHKELAAIERLDVPFIRFDLNWAEVTKPWHAEQIIPARNLLLATIGSMFSSRVWICALDGDQFSNYNDNTVEFYGMSSGLLSHTMEIWNPQGTKVESPFLSMTKADIISWWLESGRDPALLFETSSCWSGSEKCGVCGTCYRRYTSFILNGIDEKGYKSNPLKSDYAILRNKLLTEKDAALRFGSSCVREHKDLIRILRSED